MLQFMLWLLLMLVAPPPKDVELRSLVAKLGDDEYKVREDGHKALEEGMTLKRYYVLKKHRSTDAEVNRRLYRVLNTYRNRVLSDYKLDLKGYPDWPFVDSLPNGYRWAELEKWAIINRYRELAQSYGAPNDGSPIWTDYRVATKHWLQERIHSMVDGLLEGEPLTQKEFKKRAKKELQKIQEDLETMIEGDDKWWGGPAKNPLRAPKPDA